MEKSIHFAVIQAGGKGTRLLALTQDKIPKPMLELNGKPMIQWQIENLMKYGIHDFVLIIGHLGHKVKEYFGDGSSFGCRIFYIVESEPLGSAGALSLIKDIPELNEKDFSKDFFLVFGDVMFDINVNRMLLFHEQKGGLATLLVHPNSHPHDSDLIVLDESGMVTSFESKHNIRDYWYDNLVNAGIYILNRRVLEYLPVTPLKCDLEKDVLAPHIATGEIFGYCSTEYVKDAGTEERFHAVEKEQAAGLWALKNLENPQRCVFLDRDGTINRHVGLLSKPEQLKLETGVAEAINKMHEKGFLVIMITNQPVVARGMCTEADVKEIQKKLSVLLGKQGAYLDDAAFCPHHPDKGYEGENPAYKIACNCRKPATGMIDHMAEKYNIDISQSYIIGDTTIDIQTGKNAGLKTILVKTGMAGTDKKYDVKADLEAKDLQEAAELL